MPASPHTGKMGVDNFAKVLQQMVQRGGGGSDPTELRELGAESIANRLVTTASFLRMCRKVGGLQHAEVSALAERWVYGAGCPSIKVIHPAPEPSASHSMYRIHPAPEPSAPTHCIENTRPNAQPVDPRFRPQATRSPSITTTPIRPRIRLRMSVQTNLCCPAHTGGVRVQQAAQRAGAGAAAGGVRRGRQRRNERDGRGRQKGIRREPQGEGHSVARSDGC